MLIPNITMSDILLRLSENERHVCALAGDDNDGWGMILAWNPIEICESSDANTIENFVHDESAKDRLVIGYLSYDLGAKLHNVTLQSQSDLHLPSAYILSFDRHVIFDESGARSTDNEIKEILTRPKRYIETPLYDRDFEASMSRNEYREKYQKIQQHIQAGDVYQVNLTHRLETTTSASGRQIFSHSLARSQAKFGSYIEGSDFEIISSSPERFVKIKSGIIETVPIKGTRPRGHNSVDDKRLKNELADSSKDRAELNMITDLMRNDLGKICRVGSVAVKASRVITQLPTLWHAHSHIVGHLNEGISPIAALLSLMPGGSITGCPKKRAIEIIDDLEPVRRGVYTGTIFCIKPGGALDSSIAIRTVVKKSNKLYLSVGGGIVYDSNEEDEYQESLDKAVYWRQLGTSQLSSDILESQFGLTHIEILSQNEHERIICTKTNSDNKILELSYVQFTGNGAQKFPEVHNEIIAGKSIGKAFRDHNIRFTRNQLSVNEMEVPEIFQKKFGSGEQATVSRVQIDVGDRHTQYGTILEVYSPDVSWPGDHEIDSSQIIGEIEIFSNKLAEL